MKNVVSAIIISLCLAIPALAGQHQVIKVIDGDTVDVLYMGKKERIRMLNVDTPESVHPDQSRNTPMGKKASAYTKSRLTGKTVDLEFQARKRGKYGRLLAYVILDGRNFNIELVREGWSPYYTKYGTSDRHHADFVSAEKYARARGLNIWSDSGSYAKSKKAPAGGGSYHGNIRSHKFHRSGCRYYNCKHCTKVFKSRNEAIASGYEPCGICKP